AANPAPSSSRKPNSLRRTLTRTPLPLAGGRPRSRVLLAGNGEIAQAALQVEEDEADRRLGPCHRRDGKLAVPDDEHASLPRRHLELRERACIRVARHALGRVEQG